MNCQNSDSCQKSSRFLAIRNQGIMNTGKLLLSFQSYLGYLSKNDRCKKKINNRENLHVSISFLNGRASEVNNLFPFIGANLMNFENIQSFQVITQISQDLSILFETENQAESFQAKFLHKKGNIKASNIFRRTLRIHNESDWKSNVKPQISFYMVFYVLLAPVNELSKIPIFLSFWL